MTDSATTARDDSGETGPDNRWQVLAILSAALLIVIIDVTVLHVASPAIAKDLDTTPTQLLWIIDIYPLVVTPLLLATSTAADRFGRKRMLIWGLIVFTAASAFAAFAWSPAALIGARALQGIGGAMIMPCTMSLIRAVFPNRRERIKAIGIWGAVLSVGGAAGPLVGGVLVEHFWWGAVFLINVPILLLVLPFAIFGLPEVKHSDPPPWDTPSVLLIGAGILLLAYGIKDGAQHGLLEPLPIACLVVSAAAITAFIRRQLARQQPVLDVRLFAKPALAAAVGSVLLSLFALIGLELFFAQYLQLILGLGPATASLWLMPLLVAMLVGSLIAEPTLRVLGTRAALSGGFGVTAIALLPLLALGAERQFWLMAIPFAVMGFALQAASMAANDLILSSVSADEAGQAASIEATAYELGGGLGIAVLGAVGAAVYSQSLGTVPGLSSQDQASASASISGAEKLAEALPAAVSQPLLAAAESAWLTSFHAVLIIGAVLVALGALATLLIIPKTVRARATEQPAASNA